MTKRRWFRRVLWIGIVANLAAALPLLVAPDAMLTWAGLPATSPTWTRLAALLSTLMSFFYVPAAIDPDRYRVIAWLAVASRLAGGIFFLTQPREYHVLGLFDLAFFLVLALLFPP